MNKIKFPIFGKRLIIARNNVIRLSKIALQLEVLQCNNYEIDDQTTLEIACK